MRPIPFFPSDKCMGQEILSVWLITAVLGGELSLTGTADCLGCVCRQKA